MKGFRFKRWMLAPAALLVILVTSADSCSSTSSNSTESTQVSTQQSIYTKNQPVPTYQFSNERAALIQLYNQRVNGNVDTWTVWYSNSGVALGTCPSKGYPLPYGTELTNPAQVTSGGSSSSYWGVAVGQMDPNGLYPPTNTLGTWILCIQPNGNLSPLYIEPLVATYPYPMKIVNGQAVPDGAANPQSTITLPAKK